MFAERANEYRQIEKERDTKVVLFATSERPNAETQIAPDAVEIFVDLLDSIGPTKKISMILHTNGGQAATAWRIVNLVRSFCDELEVVIPSKAMSAGTLISLGADRLVMTKQAALGPIDPSLTHALSPTVPMPGGMGRVPVSVEAVRGYLDAATKDLAIKDDAALAAVLVDLSNKIHPLVLGEIFRSRAQIRFLADKLIRRQVKDEEKIKTIIDFLCADSGSHDYTINRREASEFGLNIEKPSDALYSKLRVIYKDYATEMKLVEPFAPEALIASQLSVNYALVRGLIETVEGGSYGFVTEGVLTNVAGAPMPPGAPPMITDQRTFEGWRKTP